MWGLVVDVGPRKEEHRLKLDEGPGGRVRSADSLSLCPSLCLCPLSFVLCSCVCIQTVSVREMEREYFISICVYMYVCLYLCMYVERWREHFISICSISLHLSRSERDGESILSPSVYICMDVCIYVCM